MERADISVSHRLGAPRHAKTHGKAPRPIIVRFVRRELKDEILKQRKNLRNETNEGYNPDIYINDDLTHLKNSMRKALWEHPDVSRVGTINGKLLFTYKVEGHEETVSVESPSDLVHKLGYSMEQLHAYGLCMEDDRPDADPQADQHLHE